MMTDNRIERTFEDLMNERDLLIDTKNSQSDYVQMGERNNLKSASVDKSRIVIEMGFSKLAHLFFTDQNIKKIQNALRYKAFKDLGVKISEQALAELLIIMRSVYLTYAKELLHSYPKQIADLNDKVVKECYPDLKSNILQYHQYIAKANSSLQIMEREKNVSSTGTKTLRTADVLGFGNDLDEEFVRF